jgi:hypothetical protein
MLGEIVVVTICVGQYCSFNGQLDVMQLAPPIGTIAPASTILPLSFIDPLLDPLPLSIAAPPLPDPLLLPPPLLDPLSALLRPLLDPLPPLLDVAPLPLPLPLDAPLPLNALDVLSGSPGSAAQASTMHVAAARRARLRPRYPFTDSLVRYVARRRRERLNFLEPRKARALY